MVSSPTPQYKLALSRLLQKRAGPSLGLSLSREGRNNNKLSHFLDDTFLIAFGSGIETDFSDGAQLAGRLHHHH
jgi:hypothetical protein